MKMIISALAISLAADVPVGGGGDTAGPIESINRLGNEIQGFVTMFGIAVSVATVLFKWLWRRFSHKEQKGWASWAVVDVSLLVVVATCVAVIGSSASIIEHETVRLVLLRASLISLGALLLSFLLIFGVRAQKYSLTELRELHRDVFRKAVELRENDAARASIGQLLVELETLPSFAQTAVSPIALSSVRNLLGTQTEELNVDEYTKMLMASIRHPGVNQVILFSTYTPKDWGLPPLDVQVSLGMAGPTQVLSDAQARAWQYFRDAHEFIIDRAASEKPIRMVRVMCMAAQDWRADVCAAPFVEAHIKAGINLYRVDPTPPNQLPYDMGLFETENKERLIVWSEKGNRGLGTCRVRVEYKIFVEYVTYLRLATGPAEQLVGAAHNRARDFSWGTGP